jgi:hypothetical protein
MVGANQYKDKHELQFWSFLFRSKERILMKGRTVIGSLTKSRGGSFFVHNEGGTAILIVPAE